MAIAGLYGSLGYAVLFPNEIGYGASSQVIHPYIHFPMQNI